jgi:hypothetical protein
MTKVENEEEEDRRNIYPNPLNKIAIGMSLKKRINRQNLKTITKN